VFEERGDQDKKATAQNVLEERGADDMNAMATMEEEAMAMAMTMEEEAMAMTMMAGQLQSRWQIAEAIMGRAIAIAGVHRAGQRRPIGRATAVADMTIGMATAALRVLVVGAGQPRWQIQQRPLAGQPRWQTQQPRRQVQQRPMPCRWQLAWWPIWLLQDCTRPLSHPHSLSHPHLKHQVLQRLIPLRTSVRLHNLSSAKSQGIGDTLSRKECGCAGSNH